MNDFGTNSLLSQPSSLVLSVGVAPERVDGIYTVAACPLPYTAASLAMFVKPLSEDAQPFAQSVGSVQSVTENRSHLAHKKRDVRLGW